VQSAPAGARVHANLSHVDLSHDAVRSSVDHDSALGLDRRVCEVNIPDSALPLAALPACFEPLTFAVDQRYGRDANLEQRRRQKYDSVEFWIRVSVEGFRLLRKVSLSISSLGINSFFSFE
jgi:hypothetical protein